MMSVQLEPHVRMLFFKNENNKIFSFEPNANPIYYKDLIKISHREADQIRAENRPTLPPKVTRNINLSKITHVFNNGKEIKCRPSDLANMKNALERMQRVGDITINWLDVNEQVVSLTLAELETCIESGQDQAHLVWEQFYTEVD